MDSFRRVVVRLTALATLGVAALESPRARAQFVLGTAGNDSLITETGARSDQLHRATVSGHGDRAGARTPAIATFENLATTTRTNASGVPTVNLTDGTTIDITTGKPVGNTHGVNIGSVNLGSSTSKLNLDGAGSLPGLTSDQVLFNIVGGHSLSPSTDGAADSGIVLDPGSPPGNKNTTLIGRINGGGIRKADQARSTQFETTLHQFAGPSVVPEPPAVVSAGTCVLLGLGFAWYRKWQGRAV